MRAWQKVIGRREDKLCDCGEIQNTAYVLRCPLIGDGRGRSLGEAMKDTVVNSAKRWPHGGSLNVVSYVMQHVVSCTGETGC